MESILIDDIQNRYGWCTQEIAQATIDGQSYTGYVLSKPMNYQRPYFSLASRLKMALEIIKCRAIAVHFTEDEQNLGMIPTALKRVLDDQKKGIS